MNGSGPTKLCGTPPTGVTSERSGCGRTSSSDGSSSGVLSVVGTTCRDTGSVKLYVRRLWCPNRLRSTTCSEEPVYVLLDLGPSSGTLEVWFKCVCRPSVSPACAGRGRVLLLRLLLLVGRSQDGSDTVVVVSWSYCPRKKLFQEGRGGPTRKSVHSSPFGPSPGPEESEG